MVDSRSAPAVREPWSRLTPGATPRRRRPTSPGCGCALPRRCRRARFRVGWRLAVSPDQRRPRRPASDRAGHRKIACPGRGDRSGCSSPVTRAPRHIQSSPGASLAKRASSSLIFRRAVTLKMKPSVPRLRPAVPNTIPIISNVLMGALWALAVALGQSRAAGVPTRHGDDAGTPPTISRRPTVARRPGDCGDPSRRAAAEAAAPSSEPRPPKSCRPAGAAHPRPSARGAARLVTPHRIIPG